MKKSLFLLLFFLHKMVWAQEQGKQLSQQSYFQFSGRILDSITGKGIDAASVQFYSQDESKNIKNGFKVILGGQLTKKNGRFVVDSITANTNLFYEVTAMGYQTKKVKIVPDLLQKGIKIDLENRFYIGLDDIQLVLNLKQLDEVIIQGEKPFMQLGSDRRIFNISRDLLSIGLMATDLMRNIPGLEVDVEGRVTLRNATPAFFIDGRPTMLTLDQIPADAIQRVEIITNPSAKFEASGGMAGILNLVLKKNKKPGYNGNLRTGLDSRTQLNLGGDINISQGKINIFGNTSFNQRKLIGENKSHRLYTDANPILGISQKSNPISTGYSAFASGGFDWFINKFNTLTFTVNVVRGKFINSDFLKSTFDSGLNSIGFSERIQSNKSLYKNTALGLGYKKLFSKKGMELTADFNYSANTNNSYSNFNSSYFDENYLSVGLVDRQLQDGTGNNSLISLQSDFVNPLSEKTKFEMGVRGNYRSLQNDNNNYFQQPVSGLFIPVVNLNAKYIYNDRVLAAYSSISSIIWKKISYQMGLRLESSTYKGKILNSNSTYSNTYPLSLFPSIFLTYKVDNSQDLQFSYSRRISRPTIFQLTPFYDYQDSLNIQKGNPGLRPEFTSSLEMNYNKSLKNRHTLLFSIYYKYTSSLISRYQIKEINSSSNNTTIVNTYVNANSAHAYGLEISARNPVLKWLEFSSTITLYNSGINGINLTQELIDNLWSFTARINTTFKFPSNWNMQINTNYRSKTILPRGSADVIVGGGSSFGAFVQTTAQGYVDAVYGIDFALRKEFMKDRKASLSLSISDVLRTRVNSIHVKSPFFTQDISRRRDWQILRLNFTWRFGKFNAILFKRKNQRIGTEGIQDAMQQMQ
ncbi:MAG: TonB-dependent receptor domain-containing protein [Chitinophagia bacterium]